MRSACLSSAQLLLLSSALQSVAEFSGVLRLAVVRGRVLPHDEVGLSECKHVFCAGFGRDELASTCGTTFTVFELNVSHNFN